MRSLSFDASPVVPARLFYLALLWPLVGVANRLEHRVGTCYGYETNPWDASANGSGPTAKPIATRTGG